MCLRGLSKESCSQAAGQGLGLSLQAEVNSDDIFAVLRGAGRVTSHETL